MTGGAGQVGAMPEVGRQSTPRGGAARDGRALMARMAEALLALRAVARLLEPVSEHSSPLQSSMSQSWWAPCAPPEPPGQNHKPGMGFCSSLGWSTVLCQLHEGVPAAWAAELHHASPPLGLTVCPMAVISAVLLQTSACTELGCRWMPPPALSK